MAATQRARFIVFAIPLFLGWGLLLFLWVGTPAVMPLRLINPRATAFMSLYRPKDHKPLQEWVPLQDISPYLARAVVLAEDDRFFEHPGFDWEAIKKAWHYNQRKQRLLHGASTITQQLARNLYLNPHKNFWRKFQELIIAVKLEFFLPKERILELYLNVAQWGPGVFGAEAAARYHFGKQAAELNRQESAYLASILPKPARLKPHQSTPMTQRKMEKILSQL